jgi:hypothetical protein
VRETACRMSRPLRAKMKRVFGSDRSGVGGVEGMGPFRGEMELVFVSGSMNTRRAAGACRHAPDWVRPSSRQVRRGSQTGSGFKTLD